MSKIELQGYHLVTPYIVKTYILTPFHSPLPDSIYDMASIGNIEEEEEQNIFIDYFASWSTTF